MARYDWIIVNTRDILNMRLACPCCSLSEGEEGTEKIAMCDVVMMPWCPPQAQEHRCEVGLEEAQARPGLQLNCSPASERERERERGGTHFKVTFSQISSQNRAYSQLWRGEIAQTGVPSTSSLIKLSLCALKLQTDDLRWRLYDPQQGQNPGSVYIRIFTSERGKVMVVFHLRGKTSWAK